MERVAEADDALLSFLGQRLPVPMTKRVETKNESKERRGKTLNYHKESKEVREGLDSSRRDEWEKWKKFVAGRPCRGEELQQ